ncbi:MAG TPA: hypothetical protein VJQ54_15720 [Candidatus Sulfotelmatobacter sp.]|nr:hypothetical protein [Candidatus Sulfotelmatobacter sp.]
MTDINALAGWENFYVIVGSSAGALIGLQFVVITLIADRTIGPGQAQAGDAFATPTIVHFGAVLLLSGMVNAPWASVQSAAIAWGLLGFAGIIYEMVVLRRMQTQSVYKPQVEDWLFHFLLPLGAYAALAVSTFAVHSRAHAAMFVIAAAAMLLLFVGIHNAWDAVTYHVFVSNPKRKEMESHR